MPRRKALTIAEMGAVAQRGKSLVTTPTRAVREACGECRPWGSFFGGMILRFAHANVLSIQY